MCLIFSLEWETDEAVKKSARLFYQTDRKVFHARLSPKPQASWNPVQEMR